MQRENAFSFGHPGGAPNRVELLAQLRMREFQPGPYREILTNSQIEENVDIARRGEELTRELELYSNVFSPDTQRNGVLLSDGSIRNLYDVSKTHSLQSHDIAAFGSAILSGDSGDNEECNISFPVLKLVMHHFFFATHLTQIVLDLPKCLRVGDSWLKDCPNLKTCKISANDLIEVGDHWLSDCYALHKLEIRAPILKKVGKYWIANCTSLVRAKIKCRMIQNVDIGFASDVTGDIDFEGELVARGRKFANGDAIRHLRILNEMSIRQVST